MFFWGPLSERGVWGGGFGLDWGEGERGRDRAERTKVKDRKGNVRVGLGPPTGNMDKIMPKQRKTTAVQAMGVENRAPV